jgi:solute carrier family 13 (sodium-dependent dicarboxylate transporter), member 2/3/5
MNDVSTETRSRHPYAKPVLFGVAALALSLVAVLAAPEPVHQRALVLAIVYLALALSELVEPFVPTLFLLLAIPIALGPLSNRFELGPVLGWIADPVLVLFASGFVLGQAAHRHGLDAAFAELLVRSAGPSRRGMIALVMLATAAMSMWMSNVAAAALLLATLRPLLVPSLDPPFRRALLLAVATGANLGGMATPLGSGPNAIAIAAVRDTLPITFVHWMSFGVPIVLGMLVIGFGMLVVGYRISGETEHNLPPSPPIDRRGRAAVALFAVAIAAWLTEPLHGIGAASVGLAVTLALFGSGLLDRRDLGALDWSTLGLIAGGLALGRLLEGAGLLNALASTLGSGDHPTLVWLGAFVFAGAALAAVMSNTATAALLVPLALMIDPSPSTAIIIAIATSFGMPLPISTPPNSMVYGTGEVRLKDLLRVGVPLMLIGCALVTLSGAWFLGLLGLD